MLTKQPSLVAFIFNPPDIVQDGVKHYTISPIYVSNHLIPEFYSSFFSLPALAFTDPGGVFRPKNTSKLTAAIPVAPMP